MTDTPAGPLGFFINVQTVRRGFCTPFKNMNTGAFPPLYLISLSGPVTPSSCIYANNLRNP